MIPGTGRAAAVVVGLGRGVVAPILAEALRRRTGWPVELCLVRDRYGDRLATDLDRVAQHPGARIIIGRPERGLWQLMAALALSAGPTGPEPVLAVLLGVPERLVRVTGVLAAPYPLSIDWVVDELSARIGQELAVDRTEIDAVRRILWLDWHALKYQLASPSSPERRVLTELGLALREAPVIRTLTGDAGRGLLDIEELIPDQPLVLAAGAVDPGDRRPPGIGSPEWQTLASTLDAMERTLRR